MKLIYEIICKKGYILIEAIIALSVLTVGFLSLIYLLNSAIGLNRVVAENYIATYLAAEGIEIVKNIIDNNILNPGQAWNSGLSDGLYEVDYNSVNLSPYQGSGRFLNLDNNNTYNYNSGTPTPFKRKISIQNSTDAIKVISIVSWKSRAGDSQIQLEDVFYNTAIIGQPGGGQPGGGQLGGGQPGGGQLGGSTPTSSLIDTLSFFKRQNFSQYPNININYSPTELMEVPTLMPRTLQFDQFISGNDIYLEKYRDPTQVVRYSYDNNYIYLKEDSSGQHPYSFSSGRWLKRFMQVGEVIDESNNIITEYSTTTCAITNIKPWPYKITLKEHYSSYNAGGDLGNIEVIVVEYDWTQANGGIPAIEREFYAKGYGIFKWEEYEGGSLTEWGYTPYINDTSSNPPPVPTGICFNYSF